MNWAELDTPALVVDEVRMERNLARVSSSLARAGVAVRPHWKTSKCLQVAQRQLALGAVGFTCSTPAEVLALGEAGIRGLLWAHLAVGEPKVAFAVNAVRRFGITLMVDSAAVAEPLDRALSEAGLVADVLLEVDTGLGRTGVDPSVAGAVAARLGSLTSLRLRGVMTHEGHLYGFGADRAGLDAAAVASAQSLVSVAEALRAERHAIDVVSVGSTPGLAAGPYVAGVTEARPGTYVFGDGNQVRLGSCGLDECALTVLARVVSTQREGTAIIDAGSKAMSSDAVSPSAGYGTVLDLDGHPIEGVSFPRANDEHGFLTGLGTGALAVGDLVRILPHHACATVTMWSRLAAVRPDGSYEWWPVVARH